MNTKRYDELSGFEEIPLTKDEISQGWHFCAEFDGLLRNSNEDTFKCSCNEFQDQQHDAHCVVWYQCVYLPQCMPLIELDF